MHDILRGRINYWSSIRHHPFQYAGLRAVRVRWLAEPIDSILTFMYIQVLVPGLSLKICEIAETKDKSLKTYAFEDTRR